MCINHRMTRSLGSCTFTNGPQFVSSQLATAGKDMCIAGKKKIVTATFLYILHNKTKIIFPLNDNNLCSFSI